MFPNSSGEMSMEFWDCNCFLGRPVKSIYKPAESVPALLETMDAVGIARALVWHIAQFDCSPQDGNRLASEAIRESERLLGCWAILPPVTGEMFHGTGMLREAFRPEAFLAEMKRNRTVALRAFPDQNRYLANRATFGAFLDEVAACRIPLLLSPERSIGWPAIHALLTDFPNLTCILCDIGIWGQDRYAWPLLETYPNVRVETSYLALEAGGIAASVARFGGERFVFGTGFPMRYPEASTLALIHAEISEEDKHKIAEANFDRLIQEARL